MFRVNNNVPPQSSPIKLDRRINLMHDIEVTLVNIALLIEFVSFILLIYMYTS